MNVTVIHHEDEDVGTLKIECGRDDDVTLSFDGSRSALVTLPLYSYQAREIIDALTPLANTPDPT